MATALIQSVTPNLMERLRREDAAELHQQRQQAIAIMTEGQNKLAKLVPALDRDITAAQQELDKVKADAEAAIAAATDKLRNARTAKHAAVYPVNYQVDLARSRLECVLRHPAISDALEHLKMVFNGNRQVADAEGIPHSQAVLLWVEKSRGEILALQFSPEADIDMAVQAILAGQP